MSKQEVKVIRPQDGRQTDFLSSSADIAIYGGSAGGGKSFALLLEGMRHYQKKGFVGVVFRRDSTQLRDGGLWTESQELYSNFAGSRMSDVAMTWTSKEGGILKFTHLQHEKDKLTHQGKQYGLIGFDELTHFSQSQFFYLLSRNRSVACKPYIRATCNPDADSWVAEFIDWWIGADGFAIPERSGKLRYFYRSEGVIHWADTARELIDQFEVPIKSLFDKSDWDADFYDFAKNMIKSVTFINSSIFDNKILLKSNPDYLASLQAQDKVNRERLLNGNWKIRQSAGMYFKEEYFPFVPALPKNIVSYCRSWDLASSEPTPTNPSPDATTGVLMAKDSDGYFYIVDLKWLQGTPARVKDLILNTAVRDKEKYGSNLTITVPQDPGQAGKGQAQDLIRMLSGFNARSERPTGDKVTRASALSAQSEVGNVKVLTGEWNNKFIREMESFPEGKHDDIVDAAADSFNNLSVNRRVKVRTLD